MENVTKVKSEISVDIKDELYPLWEGGVSFKDKERDGEIQIPVKIVHKDDSKDGCNLFDWTSDGENSKYFLLLIIKVYFLHPRQPKH